MAGAQRWLVGGVRVAEEVGFKEVEVVVEERLLGEGSFSEVQVCAAALVKLSELSSSEVLEQCLCFADLRILLFEHGLCLCTCLIDSLLA